MREGWGICEKGGVHARRVGHVGGAQDVRMGAGMCERGPGRVGRMCGSAGDA